GDQALLRVTGVEDEPYGIKTELSKVLLLDPEVNSTNITPHPSCPVFVGVDLQEQSPIRGTRFKLDSFRFLKVRGTSAINPVRRKLAFKLHGILNQLRMPEQPVLRQPTGPGQLIANGPVRFIGGSAIL